MLKNYQWILAFIYAFIVLSSFFLFSPVFTLHYNTDQAVHVLMAADFDFSSDLYYWGQTRLGSFLPMISSVLLKIFPISPIWMVSLIQYALLAAGFYFISAHIKNHLIKIPLCLFWFFPLNHFCAQVLIGQPYSAQFFFIGLSIFLVSRWNVSSQKSTWKHSLRIFSIGMTFFLSIWISDLSFFITPIFMCFVLLFLRSNRFKFLSTSNVINKSDIKRLLLYGLVFIAGAMLALTIFIYAKNMDDSLIGYPKIFSEMNQVGTGFLSVFHVLYKAFVFRVFDIPTSIISCSILIILVLFIVAFLRNQKSLEANRFLGYFFLFSSVVTFAAAIASDWVEKNGYNTRYFTFSFFLLIAFIASHLSLLNQGKIKKITIIIFWMSSLFSVINSIKYELGELTYESIPFKHAKSFTQKLGRCGIIGDYWHSYVFSSTNPYEVVATPNDCCGPVRKPSLIKEVMMKDKIIVIKNGWLEEFPEHLMQFGYELNRKGIPQKFEDLEYCVYELQK